MIDSPALNWVPKERQAGGRTYRGLGLLYTFPIGSVVLRVERTPESRQGLSGGHLLAAPSNLMPVLLESRSLGEGSKGVPIMEFGKQTAGPFCREN